MRGQLVWYPWFSQSLVGALLLFVVTHVGVWGCTHTPDTPDLGHQQGSPRTNWDLVKTTLRRIPWVLLTAGSLPSPDVCSPSPRPRPTEPWRLSPSGSGATHLG